MEKGNIITTLRSLGRFILYVLVIMLFVVVMRVFLFNFYRIPSDSMEPSILPGDFILAQKWTYGARIFTTLKFDPHNDPSLIRLPGTGHIRRNDVVVFNYPIRVSRDIIQMDVNRFFVKRCIALPGDSISVRDSYYHIPGVSDTVGYPAGQRRLAEWDRPFAPGLERTFPYDPMFNWTIRNFGPLYVPAAGDEITITQANFRLYQKMIAYETKSDVGMREGRVLVNGLQVDRYTFRTNWYFMAGDHVLESQDSRYLGLIPEDYIIGKASVILSSTDMETGKRRWNRILKKIK